MQMIVLPARINVGILFVLQQMFSILSAVPTYQLCITIQHITLFNQKTKKKQKKRKLRVKRITKKNKKKILPLSCVSHTLYIPFECL